MRPFSIFPGIWGFRRAIPELSREWRGASSLGGHAKERERAADGPNLRADSGIPAVEEEAECGLFEAGSISSWSC